MLRPARGYTFANDGHDTRATRRMLNPKVRA